MPQPLTSLPLPPPHGGDTGSNPVRDATPFRERPPAGAGERRRPYFPGVRLRGEGAVRGGGQRVPEADQSRRGDDERLDKTPLQVRPYGLTFDVWSATIC